MKPTLYYAPNTCALASHIALEEAGADVDYVRLDLYKGDTRHPAYLKLNPKGRVPVMMTERAFCRNRPPFWPGSRRPGRRQALHR